MAGSNDYETILVDQTMKDIVAEELGDLWKRLARRLLVKESVIMSLDKEDSLYEKCYQSLTQWMQEKPSTATVSVLVEHLRYLRRLDLAEKIEECAKAKITAEGPNVLQGKLGNSSEDSRQTKQETKSSTESEGTTASARSNSKDDILRCSAVHLLELYPECVCGICETDKLPAYDTIIAHLNEQEHRKKALLKIQAVTDQCIMLDEQVSSNILNNHVSSSTSNDAISVAIRALKTKVCSKCEKAFNGYQPLMEHLKGRSHLDKLKKQTLN